MPLSAVEKALHILLAFRTDHPTWGVRELAAHLRLSPATVQRLLQTLKNYGFVDQDPESRLYRLGNVYFGLLDVLQSHFPVTREATPFMKELALRTDETVHLNVIDGRDRICIDSLESLQSLKAGMPIGNRSPLYAGASSKCLLAFASDAFIEDYLHGVTLRRLTENTLQDRKSLRAEIERIRKEGYARSLGERTAGLGSLSVPVFNHRGDLLAALSLAIPGLRFQDPEHSALCLEALMEVGRRFSEKMGYRGPYPKEWKD